MIEVEILFVEGGRGRFFLADDADSLSAALRAWLLAEKPTLAGFLDRAAPQTVTLAAQSGDATAKPQWIVTDPSGQAHSYEGYEAAVTFFARLAVNRAAQPWMESFAVTDRAAFLRVQQAAPDFAEDLQAISDAAGAADLPIADVLLALLFIGRAAIAPAVILAATPDWDADDLARQYAP